MKRGKCIFHYLAVSSSCASVNFTCRSGQCITRRKVCDGQPDCSDGSDEDTRFCCKYTIVSMDCIFHHILLALYTCRPTEYRYLSGGCIPYVERCDRKIGKNFSREKKLTLIIADLMQIVMMVVMKIIHFNRVFIRNVLKDNSLVLIFVVLIISNVAMVS